MTQTDLQKTRIENKLPVAREGIPFIIIGLVITIIFFAVSIFSLGIFFGLFTLFTIYFFRDPDRYGPVEEDALLSPADGTVLGVYQMEDSGNLLGGPGLKISIFMSVFNVHVNRIPVKGRIKGIKYNPGRFLSANLDKASEENENNRVTLDTEDGQRIIFVQIAGLIARRIVCWVKEGDTVNAGQRFGLIRFGSRVDIYMPPGSRVMIKPREKVKAGRTIIGYLP
jgi:phosphatidylserine decarboxylase